MSGPQEATDVTLTTEVEAGASGYSVTGGGDEGIFVKQVLKDSSAAKLFSLREGDQLLSATIFFDNIKYEDALKILQYSEPYKVQFQVRRKRPATDKEAGAARGAQPCPTGTEKQDKDAADSSTETPSQTLEGSGDQERLLAKPREGRGRRPQRERLSWPKFQSITSKHRLGPRRSHSSSEAYGHGDAPDVSPRSTDTEAELPAGEQGQKAGLDGQRRKSFLNLRFRMGSGKDQALEGRPSRGGLGGGLQAGVLEEAGSWEDQQQATEATVLSRREDRTTEGLGGTRARTAEPPIEPGAPTLGTEGKGASIVTRHQKQTKEAKDREDAVSEGKAGVSTAPRGGGGQGQVAQAMEVGVARSALQGREDTRVRQPEFQIQIPNLKTPMFKFSKERKEDTEGSRALVQEETQGGTAEGEPRPEPEAPRGTSAHVRKEGPEGAEGGPREDKGRREDRGTALKFNIPSFGWSPRKEMRAAGGKATEDGDRERGERMGVSALQTGDKDVLGEKGKERLHMPEGHTAARDRQTEKPEKKQWDLSLGDKEVAARDSKFKMPKFKMPSFGVSAASKDLGTSVDVSVPKVEAEATLPSLAGELGAPEGGIQLPAADIELPGAELEVSLPEGELTVSGMKGKAEGVKFKGQVPKVQMPSLKMPKVDIKAPQVDIKGPRLDLKGAKGAVSAPDVEVSLPSAQVDVQVPGAKLEADLSLGDKEVAARDSKFKMPKFKMPSFGASAPSKSLEASVDTSLPKLQAEVSVPSKPADVKTSDVTIELPTADLEIKTASVGLTLPEGQVPTGELQEPSAGAGLKGHLPKVQMPSLKMPKVDIKAPQVDIKGPKLDLKGAKADVSALDISASLPGVELDPHVCGSQLAGDVTSAVGKDFPPGCKVQISEVSLSSSGPSSSKPSVASPRLPGGDDDTDLSTSAGLRHIVVSGSDQHAFHPEGDVPSCIGKGGEKSKSKISLIKFPKVFSPPGKTARGSAASAEEPEVPSPGEASASPLESEPGRPSTSVADSLLMSVLGGLSGPHAEIPSLSPREGVTLTKYQVTVPRGQVPFEWPPETLSGSQTDSQLPSPAGAGPVPSSDSVLLSQPDGDTGPVDTGFPESYGRVTFPKFYRPKFGLSLLTSATAGVEPGAPECAAPESPQLAVQGLDSTEEATACPAPGPPRLPAGVSVSEVAQGHTGTSGTSAGTPADAGAGHTGKGRPVRAARFRLPSFSWSLKKGAESEGEPGRSPAGDADALDGPPGGPIPPAEAGADVPPGQEAEAGAVRTSALALPEVAPPGIKASPGGAGLPRGGLGLASGGGGVGGAGGGAGPSEGADESLHLPQAPVPSSGFVKADLGPGEATVQEGLAADHLPLSTLGLSLGDSTPGPGLGDSPAGQLHGEGTAALLAEGPLPPSPAVSSPGPEAPAGESPSGPRESWFRVPSLRLPGFRQPPKERAGSAGAPGAGEAGAGVRRPQGPAPASEVCGATSPQPLEAGGPASSYADVLRRNLDLPVPEAGLPASEVRVRPGAGSLPLLRHGAPAEPGALPGEAGEPPLPGPAGPGLARGPEGPLRLRASSTDVPSQVSVVSVRQVWEDSVLRVQFPKLKVPRFSLPAPGLDDVFVPSVRRWSCPQSPPDTALLRHGAGGQGTHTPEAPTALGLPLEAAPISKVRVHIQGAEVASRQVAVRSTVTTVYPELSGPGVVPTQIVRESETQTPSDGFSLLKGRIPEPPTWARVHMVPADCGPAGHREPGEPAVPGPDPISGDLQPDTGEPFEIICPSVDEAGPPARSPDLDPGLGRADSGSDEEPAEILEFPPEEGQEAEAAGALATKDQAPKAKPEGKRSSGLFRFWLPSIGFSSSVSETRADSQAGAQRPAPVQTQPEARPPPSQERGGWLRFPKLGFSSSPTKKSQSAEEEASPAEDNLQEEAGPFYDAQESLSPEEPGAGEPAEAVGAGQGQGSGTTVTSAARTEPVLLERVGDAPRPPAPGPATQ